MYIYLFYLLIIRQIHILPLRSRRASSPKTERRKKDKLEKRRRRRKGSRQRTKPLNPTWAVDALIGDEEQKGKQKKKHEAGPQPIYLDHLVNSCDPHIV